MKFFRRRRRFSRLMQEVEYIMDEIDFIEIDPGLLNDHQIDMRKAEVMALRRKAAKVIRYAHQLNGSY